jgi:putative endonuclease
MAADALGRHAEDMVARSWQAQGFEVLARRLRTGAGEIDLVVANASTLVFVEVKSRRDVEAAAYAVMPRQQRRLLAAAESALGAHEQWHRPETRFDVALVCKGAVHEIRDAIRADQVSLYQA